MNINHEIQINYSTSTSEDNFSDLNLLFDLANKSTSTSTISINMERAGFITPSRALGLILVCRHIYGITKKKVLLRNVLSVFIDCRLQKKKLKQKKEKFVKKIISRHAQKFVHQKQFTSAIWMILTAKFQKQCTITENLLCRKILVLNQKFIISALNQNEKFQIKK